MIISQTPYRVSFAGGGTDLPAYYEKQFGAVLSVTINRHMYVAIHHRFSPTVRVAYSKTETVESIGQLEHTIVREALKTTGLSQHLEITTIGDVPAGTGMGSSSTLAVGLLNAMYAYSGKVVNPERLAADACEIEIDRLGNPIGRQDQYAAAYGGVNYFRFNPDHTVDVEPVPARPETLRELESRILVMYTNKQRDANKILKTQSESTISRMVVLTEMRDLASEMRETLLGSADLDQFAEILHQGWELKRSLGFGITNTNVDAWYEAARSAGAQGGKLLGAGGGGFLLLIAPSNRHNAIREALGRPRELPFDIDHKGSRIAFISDHQ